MGEIELKHLIYLLRKNIVSLVAFALIGALISALFTTFIFEKKYNTRVRFFVNILESGHLDHSLNNAQIYARNALNVYLEILDTDTFYSMVIEDSMLDYTIEQMKNALTFSIRNSTEVFEGKAVASSPSDAMQIADSLTRVVIKFIGEFQEGVQLDVIEQPKMPTHAFNLNLQLNVVIGLIFGVLSAATGVVVKDWFSVRVENGNLEYKYGIPVLAEVPGVKRQALKSKYAKKRD